MTKRALLKANRGSFSIKSSARTKYTICPWRKYLKFHIRALFWPKSATKHKFLEKAAAVFNKDVKKESEIDFIINNTVNNNYYY